jgi:hypothetical protein
MMNHYHDLTDGIPVKPTPEERDEVERIARLLLLPFVAHTAYVRIGGNNDAAPLYMKTFFSRCSRFDHQDRPRIKEITVLVSGAYRFDWWDAPLSISVSKRDLTSHELFEMQIEASEICQSREVDWASLAGDYNTILARSMPS